MSRHYTSPRVAYSLRKRSPRISEVRARRAADQLDEYWYHLRCRDAELPGKHMLRLKKNHRSRGHRPAGFRLLLICSFVGGPSGFICSSKERAAPCPSSRPLREHVGM
ncbi:hypothetical protein [uncultured Shimia sp.]|uniref:hypothetical protein n=1 Tax=uncultured Shimia sp. TaxID=573152 RepID=UPI0034241127